MLTENSDTKDAVQRVKQEIDRLNDQQAKALKHAIYIGRSPDEPRNAMIAESKLRSLLKNWLAQPGVSRMPTL